MTPTPKLKVERIAQLDPGELFLFEHDGVRCGGFLCDYRDPNQIKLVLPLGPRLPQILNGPQLLDPRLLNLNPTAISFGKAFVVQLPVDLNNWSETPPTDEYPCLMVTSVGIYFRAKDPTTGAAFAPCYINIGTGMVEVGSGQSAGLYTVPAGMAAYPTSWKILTNELEPRPILKYPFPADQP